ncbi:MAG: hypothetical protein R3C17_04970 [Planctomycetaceae bacterium]
MVSKQAGWLRLSCIRTEEYANSQQRDASNKGCLPMTLDEYLRLLDWTGRQLRRDKTGSIPVEFARFSIDWTAVPSHGRADLVRNFRKRFRQKRPRGHIAERQLHSDACRHATCRPKPRFSACSVPDHRR